MPALAGRPPVSEFTDRCNGKHPSRRVLHRQAVLARRAGGAPGAARAARLRDAAALADVVDATASVAFPGVALLAAALPAGAAQALGHRGARPLHAAVVRVAGPRRCSYGNEPIWHAARERVVRAALRVPLSALRRVRCARVAGPAARGA